MSVGDRRVPQIHTAPEECQSVRIKGTTADSGPSWQTSWWWDGMGAAALRPTRVPSVWATGPLSAARCWHPGSGVWVSSGQCGQVVLHGDGDGGMHTQAVG